ncbi:MAG: 4-(cytidine 5'-diphospho)-2-C-methyl-D-erythritol kinase [Sphingomonadaceae bacterium]|nr:4-(cytidine 5'-diphospho)-2-C-methyl-D-erythritol kinase [Sphingomonadaceae bacterium]
MTEAPVRETAHAKINLALHVRERMDDGYHRLETLFAFAEDGDVLTAQAASDISLTISGQFADGLPSDERNLVVTAANALRVATGTAAGAALHLEKKLPVASGIGGGSADAAAVLRLLVRLWKLDGCEQQFAAIAKSLGADVPACLLSETCFGEGRGERLRPLSAAPLRDRPLLLINPGVALETGRVFADWDGRDRGGLVLSEPLEIDAGWRNDLEAPAIGLVPEIGDVLAELRGRSGVEFSAMSGSGATCFGLFERIEDRDAAAEKLSQTNPDWWLMMSSLR